MSEERQRLTSRASAAVAFLTMGLAATRFVMQGPGSEVGAVLAVAAGLFAALAAEGGRRLPAAARGHAVATIGLLALVAMSALEGGLHSEAMFWLPFTPIAATLLVDERGALVQGIGATAWVGALLALDPSEASFLHAAAVGGATWFGAALAVLYDRQRAAEAQASAQRETRLNQLLDSLPIGLLVVDPSDQVVHRSNLRMALAHADASWLEKLDRLDGGGTSLHDAVAQAVREARERDIVSRRAAHSGEGLAERQLEVRAMPLTGGRTAVATLDVTGHARLARMEDAFVANVSHELRTPLAATLGALKLLAHGVDHLSPEQWPVLLEVALRNAERLASLVDDLLDLQQLTDGALPLTSEPVALHEVAAAVRDELQLLAGEGGVHLQIEGPSCQVTADAGRVHQVVVNLVSNAIKFSPAGANVVLRTSSDAGCAQLDVIDRGRGIPAEDHAKVFTRFGQVDAESDRERGGTGLGLPLSLALAQRMGGDLTLDSRPGQGTTFTLTLPLAQR